MAFSATPMTAALDLPDLLGLVAAGDRSALRSLYERQSPRLFGIANAILRDRDVAADAVQDVFLKVAKRAGQFDRTRGTAEAWLAGIARHAALDILRARGRELPTDDPTLGDEAVTPEAEARLVATAEGRRLRDCLAALEPKNRFGIILAFVHGLSHPQIAEQLGTPLGTTKSWIRRGLSMLKECLS